MDKLLFYVKAMIIISYKLEIQFFEVLEQFWRGFEDPRSDRIYSSRNRGVKKGPGPRGTRDEEFLVASLVWYQGILKATVS